MGFKATPLAGGLAVKKLLAILSYTAAMLALAWALSPAIPAALEEGAEPAALIPLRDFFANAEDTGQYKISPDGKRLGWIGAYENNPTVLFRRLDELTVHAIRADRAIDNFWWTQDSRRIFFSWDANGDENWHLMMADTDHPEAPYRDLTPWPDTRVWVYQVFPDDPSRVLISHNRRNKEDFDLYRLDVDTGAEQLIERNPGDVTRWITTPAGALLARRRGGGGRDFADWTVEVRQDGAWVPTFSGRWNDSFWIVGNPLDAHEVYALSNRGRDRVALVQIDLTTGVEKVIHDDPDVDVDGAWTDRKTYALRTAWSMPDRAAVRYFDEEVGTDLESFREGDVNVWINSWSRDDRIWTVGTESDTASYSWYLFDRDTKQRRLLATAAISKYADEFSPMEPVSFNARDGERIHGYLTVPKGYARRGLPLIVDVHGGPWWRVRWGYQHDVQFLVNRGYAVLQVNYRGSKGYGRRFMEAGFGEVGGSMQDDLLDAVAWATAQGIADPKRVAIYGWGYGGYAALAGLTFTPDTFAAGISGAGVADWVDALKNLPPYWHHTETLYRAFVGDPDDPAQLARLRAISPLFHTERIQSPVLVVSGANDARGLQAQSENFVEALEQRGDEVQHLVFPDEGRWLQKWQNRVRFHRALESFLASHLGGRLSSYDSVELWIELQE